MQLLAGAGRALCLYFAGSAAFPTKVPSAVGAGVPAQRELGVPALLYRLQRLRPGAPSREGFSVESRSTAYSQAECRHRDSCFRRSLRRAAVSALCPISGCAASSRHAGLARRLLVVPGEFVGGNPLRGVSLTLGIARRCGRRPCAQSHVSRLHLFRPGRRRAKSGLTGHLVADIGGPAAGMGLALSWLLDRRLSQDGIQGEVHALGGAYRRSMAQIRGG